MMGNLRGRLRRLGRELDETLVAVEHEDGTTTRFREEKIFPEAFLHETTRWRRASPGFSPRKAHPFTVTLRTAKNQETLASEQGTTILHFLGEDDNYPGCARAVGTRHAR